MNQNELPINKFKMLCFETYRKEPLLKREIIEVAEWVISGIEEKYYLTLGITEDKVIQIGENRLRKLLHWATFLDDYEIII